MHDNPIFPAARLLEAAPALVSPLRSQLLVVDMQEKLLSAMAGHERIAERACALAATARELELPILVSEQYPRGLGATVPALKDRLGPGADIHAKLAFSCLDEPNLAGALQARTAKGRTQVLVCGVEAHICVAQTALALLARGLDVFVVVDAVGSRREEDRATALQRLRDEGARLVTTEMVLFEWVRSADAPAFKAVSGRVKQFS